MNPKEKVKEITVIEHSIPFDILDDLCSRFIINVPEEERKDLVRICFQIELAHWFYLDFYCEDKNETTPMKLKPCGMKEFTTHIFQHIPSLNQFCGKIDEVLESWREYKQAVPTFGAILLTQDLTQVLLVQSFWAKASWGFPKGKVNKEEEPAHCAIREVFEETGFNISTLLDPCEYIESTVNDQLVRLYIIRGVQQNTKFQPRTRHEIKAIEWFPVTDLPTNKRDMTCKTKLGVGPNSFFMVLPFIRRLRRWITDNRQHNTRVWRQRYKSTGDLELSTNAGSNVKSKKSHYNTYQISVSLKEDFVNYHQYHSQKVFTNSVCSSPFNYNQRHSQRVFTNSACTSSNQQRYGRRDRKQPFRRKLTYNTQEPEKEYTILPRPNGATEKLRRQTTKQITDLCSQTWLNFKFDKLAIMKKLDPE